MLMFVAVGTVPSLGATRGRLARLLMTESLLLSAAGGVVGIGLAYWAIQLFLGQAAADLPRLDEVRLDARVVGFEAVVSAGVGLLVGLFPAWRLPPAGPLTAMQSQSRSMIGGAKGRLRSVLVGVEVWSCAMCLILAGLLLHSFVRLLSVERGFDTQGVLTVDLTLPPARYPDLDDRAALLQATLDRVRAHPGVVSGGVTNALPLGGRWTVESCRSKAPACRWSNALPRTSGPSAPTTCPRWGSGSTPVASSRMSTAGADRWLWCRT